MTDIYSEQTKKRNENRCNLLRALHFNGSLTKTAISDCCNLRKSSITNIVSELLESGWIIECSPGRVRSQLMLNPDSWFFMSVLLTRENLTLARVNFLGDMDIILTDEIKDTSPKVLTEHIASAIKANRNNEFPEVVAVSFPGIVDAQSGTVLYAANFPGWSNIPLGDMLYDRTGCKVKITNDVKAQLLAEGWFSHIFKQSDNVMLLNISGGISCAMFIHGQEVIGAQNSAGEIGHIAAGDEGKLCSCGKLDCLEAYCSIPAMIKMIRESFPDVEECKTASDIYALMKNERRVENIIERCCSRITRVLAPLMAAIDPKLLIVATEFCDFSSFIAQALNNYLKIELAGLSSRDIDITISQPVSDGALRGAAVVLIEEAFATGIISGNTING